MLPAIDHFTYSSVWQPVSGLLSNSEVDTFSSGKRNPWFVAFASNENVGDLGGKAVAFGIFHMNRIKTARMSLCW